MDMGFAKNYLKHFLEYLSKNAVRLILKYAILQKDLKNLKHRRLFQNKNVVAAQMVTMAQMVTDTNHADAT